MAAIDDRIMYSNVLNRYKIWRVNAELKITSGMGDSTLIFIILLYWMGTCTGRAL